MSTTFATLGDILMRRYVTDYIGSLQQLSSPIYSRIKTNGKFQATGDGARFAVRIDGNEVKI